MAQSADRHVAQFGIGANRVRFTHPADAFPELMGRTCALRFAHPVASVVGCFGASYSFKEQASRCVSFPCDFRALMEQAGRVLRLRAIGRDGISRRSAIRASRCVRL